MDRKTVSSTTPFYTLDPFNGALASELMPAIEHAQHGDTLVWEALIEREAALKQRLTEQGIVEPTHFTSIRWDSANLLFTSCVELNTDGRPIPIGENLTREQFGRFPFGNGSALEYLLEHIRPNKSITEHDGESIYTDLLQGLNQLTHGCREAYRGHRMFEDGFAGMSISGFLTAPQVLQLRKNLSSRAWTVSFDEPLDGGVADVTKHLSALLKAAERRRVGLVLRTHQ
jgi:hypothetical protein